MTTLAETFDQALRHHQVGDFRQAEQLYREILHVEPSHFDALHLLGLLAHQVGRSDLAIDYISQAVRLKPDFSYAHNNLGAALRQQGRLAEALACFGEAVRLEPTNVDAHFNLGIAFHEQGRSTEAVACLREALRLRPDHGNVYNMLGNLLGGQGKFAEAEANYRQALALQPDFAEAYNNLGNLLREQRRWDEAAASLQQALRIQPNFAVAQYNLGLTFQEQDKLEEAAASYQQAVRLQPDHANAYNNLGKALADLRRPEEAEASYGQALRLVPGHVAAHCNLAQLLKEAGKPEEAQTHWQEALRLESTPSLRAQIATLLPTIYQSRDELLFWRGRLTDNVRQLHKENFTLDLSNQTAPPPFLLAYQGFNDRDLQRELTALYVAPAEPTRPASSGRTGKIKVGFISRFFKNHTVGRLMRGLIAQLARDTFDVTALSVGSAADAIGQFIRQQADRAIDVPGQLPAARRLIAAQELDVLFYTDLGMDDVTYSLAFSRLAPVQCVAWGHGVTTGIPTIDYFFSGDLLETEEGDQHYTERLVRLPNLGVYYYRPVPPTPLKGRAHFGLPEEAHLYGCLQSLFKFHPDLDPLLGGILRRDPRGVLVLIQGRYPYWEELLRRRFAVTLPDVLDRILFLPSQAYPNFLNLTALLDVLVDPLYNVGGNSSFEGLALGVPIVTLPGQLLGGRITRALYAQMNIWDCVVGSAEEYVDKAVQLGTDADYRAAVRAKIQGGSGVLFENPAGVRGLEQFLQKVATIV